MVHTCPTSQSATSSNTKRQARRQRSTRLKPRNSCTRQEPHKPAVLSALVILYNMTPFLRPESHRTDRPPQILASMMAATTLSLAPNALPSVVRFGISPAALVLTLFVRAHVSNFWTAKAKVPFIDGYVRLVLLFSLPNTSADKRKERGNLEDKRAFASPRVARVHLGWNCAC